MPTPVSIVVPAFNAADYIAETIESLLAQDHPALAIVVVDDGSTDATGDIAARYEGRIRLHRQSNAGQSAAMATGWAMTSGSLIGYLSADDRLKPSAIRRCGEALDARPGVVLVYPDFDVIDAKSERLFTVETPDFSRRALFSDLHCLPGPGALFRRSTYEKIGPWRSDLQQIPDLEFFLRMALEGDFYRVPEVLAEFRRHPRSTTFRAVPFERGEEPLKVVASLFARADLPADVLAWKGRSRANARLLSAVIHGQSGRPGLAVRRLAAAFANLPTGLSKKTLGHALTIARQAFARRAKT